MARSGLIPPVTPFCLLWNCDLGLCLSCPTYRFPLFSLSVTLGTQELSPRPRRAGFRFHMPLVASSLSSQSLYATHHIKLNIKFLFFVCMCRKIGDFKFLEVALGCLLSVTKNGELLFPVSPSTSPDNLDKDRVVTLVMRPLAPSFMQGLQFPRDAGRHLNLALTRRPVPGQRCRKQERSEMRLKPGAGKSSSQVMMLE